MECLKPSNLISFQRPWITCPKSWSDWSKKEELQAWLDLQKTSEEREKQRNLEEDRPNRSWEKEKMCSTKNWWVYIREQLTLTCRISLGKQLTKHLLCKHWRRLSSRHRLLTSSSTRWSPRRTNQKCLLKILCHLSLFQMWNVSKFKRNFNSKKRSSWKQLERSSKLRLQMLVPS